MTKERLNEVLKEHEKWLMTRFGLNPEGSRANLCDADLCDADLRDANLCRADLCRADLRDADLRGADLRGADLRGCQPVPCRPARCRPCAVPTCAMPTCAVPTCAVPTCAVPTCAVPTCAVPTCAVPTCAMPNTMNELLCTHWLARKKERLLGIKKAGGLIVELQITETAKRSSATTRKCRCSEAIVAVDHQSGRQRFGSSAHNQ